MSKNGIRIKSTVENGIEITSHNSEAYPGDGMSFLVTFEENGLAFPVDRESVKEIRNLLTNWLEG